MLQYAGTPGWNQAGTAQCLIVTVKQLFNSFSWTLCMTRIMALRALHILIYD